VVLEAEEKVSIFCAFNLLSGGFFPTIACKFFWRDNGEIFFGRGLEHKEIFCFFVLVVC